MHQQILSPYTPEGAIYYGQHQLAKAQSRNDPFATTYRGNETLRTQKLAFWSLLVFKSQLVKEGEDFLLKEGTSKDSQGFAPYQH